MAGEAAFGTTLTIDATPVAELTNIGGPNVTADALDVTSHDSADDYKEFVAGLLDGGEVSLEGNLTTAAAGNVMMDAANARNLVAVVITFPTTPTIAWSFNGIVTGFSTGAPVADKLSFSGSIKVTGIPTLA